MTDIERARFRVALTADFFDEDGISKFDDLGLGVFDDYDSIEVEDRTVEGLQLPVATPEMLFRMKRDTVRTQDRADAERLRAMFGLED